MSQEGKIGARSSRPLPRGGARRCIHAVPHRYFTGSILPVLAAIVPVAAGAQRDVQRYGANDVEGRLMAYYSAVLAFSPAGLAEPLPAGGLEGAIELSLVPRLTSAQRSAGYDKPEATNLAPIFPRPRVRFGLARRITVEGSWLPPVRVFGVTANLVALGVVVPLDTIGGGSLMLRASGMGGRITGPITCNGDVARGSQDLGTYYRTVCRAHDSRDYFEPRHLGVEVLYARRGRWSPFVAAGVRADIGTRFDIGVIRADSTYRDPDHPVLELRSLRPQFMAGVKRRLRARVSGTLEIFHAPGSVVTARSALVWGVR